MHTPRTAACLQDGWLDTGDNGYFDEQGYLHFFDRTKDIIKRSGENIAASEVERVLNEHPDVLESAVDSGMGSPSGTVTFGMRGQAAPVARRS